MKYEYQILFYMGGKPSEKDLNRLGAQGWRVAGTTYGAIGMHVIMERSA